MPFYGMLMQDEWNLAGSMHVCIVATISGALQRTYAEDLSSNME
jgi:hypothetical protein